MLARKENRVCRVFCLNWVSNILITVSNMSRMLVGYHDTPLNFGIVKKDKATGNVKYKPASDFGFDILAEVICSSPTSSGFMINLTPDRSRNQYNPPSSR